jgi:hypothetical protein
MKKDVDKLVNNMRLFGERMKTILEPTMGCLGIAGLNELVASGGKVYQGNNCGVIISVGKVDLARYSGFWTLNAKFLIPIEFVEILPHWPMPRSINTWPIPKFSTTIFRYKITMLLPTHANTIYLALYVSQDRHIREGHIPVVI